MTTIRQFLGHFVLLIHLLHLKLTLDSRHRLFSFHSLRLEPLTIEDLFQYTLLFSPVMVYKDGYGLCLLTRNVRSGKNGCIATSTYSACCRAAASSSTV
jgi:hypothetical protein